MTQTAHLGESQQPSVLPEVANLSHYSGLLGNPRLQASTAVLVKFREEEFPAWTFHNQDFGAVRKGSKLGILKRRTFVPEGREERIRLALAALAAPQPINLAPAQWKAVVEEVEDEDED